MLTIRSCMSIWVEAAVVVVVVAVVAVAVAVMVVPVSARVFSCALSDQETVHDANVCSVTSAINAGISARNAACGW
jgi:hypothetical protein